MPYRFHRDFEVRWKDIDAAGVLNHAVYLTFLEQLRFHYFGELGLMRGQNFPFLLGETTVRFERPARAGETLRGLGRTARLGGKSFDMEYELRRGDERLAIGRATLIWVGEDLASRAIPDAARAKIAAFEGIAERG